MMAETPQLVSSYYGSTTAAPEIGGAIRGVMDKGFDLVAFNQKLMEAQERSSVVFPRTEIEQKHMNNQKRIVKVFIADPDKRVPVDKSLLFSGDEQLTDLTDQELFFDIDIKTALEKHNADRAKIVDNETSQKFGKDVFLEAIKIRDLKMHVVTIATF